MYVSQITVHSHVGAGTACSANLLYDRLDRIVGFIDPSGAARSLFIDFSKVFDKFLHSSISASAVKFGIHSDAVALIGSFFV